MGFFFWILLGLVAGVIAKLLMPGKDPGGFIVTIVIGIVGAVIGGFFSQAIGFGGVSGFGIRSLLIAMGGSILLLLGYRYVKPSS